VIRQNIDWTRRSINEHRAVVQYNRAQELFSQDNLKAAREALEQALEIINDGPVAFSSRQLLDLIDHPDQLPTAGVMTFNPSPTRSEIDHLNQLIATKDFETAIGFLEAMRGRLGIDQQEWLDDRIREIRRTLDYNLFVDQYNRAVDLYNNRQYEDAVQVLEALISTLPKGRESESVKALLDDALEALE